MGFGLYESRDLRGLGVHGGSRRLLGVRVQGFAGLGVHGW